MLRLSAAFLFCALAATASAEWTGIGSSDEHSADARVIYRHVDLHDSLTGKNEIIDLAIFLTKSCRLRVIDNADGANDLRTALPSANCVAGVNGGYFDPNFAPLGLRIIDGKITSRLSRGRLMSGVLHPTRHPIFRVGEFSSAENRTPPSNDHSLLILQTGSRFGSDNRLPEPLASTDRAALVYCPDATLADLAQMLTTRLRDFKIQRALNLDGGSSTGLYFKGARGLYLYPEEKTVRDFVGVVAR